MRTNTPIKIDIDEQFGFFPFFLTPVSQMPQGWEELQQQSQSVYGNNPLPVLFKEKLLTYLSRFCSVSSCLLYHSCALSALGMSGAQILALLQLPIPTQETDLAADFLALKQPKINWSGQEKLEQSLLRCSVLMFLQPTQAQKCRTQVHQFLGSVLYEHLVAFLGYTKLCHHWLESYPEFFTKGEQPIQRPLAALLQEEQALATFLQPHHSKLRGQFSRAEAEDNSLISEPLPLASDRQEQIGIALETLINALPDYLYVVERDSLRILFCNDVLAQGLGWEKGDALKGKKIFECFHPTDAEVIVKRCCQQSAQDDRQVFVSGQPWQSQETLTLIDGLHHVDTNKIPLKKADGEVYAFMSLSRDLSELIDSQQVLSEQTRQLEATNQELESFAYSVSHDLHAPLRAIDGFSQVVGERYDNILDEKGKHYLQRIRANSQRMGKMIDDLLQMSRVTRRPLTDQLVDLSAIAQEISFTLRNANPQRRINWLIEPNLTAKGDARLLEVVLTQLLENAWKYTSHHPSASIEFGAICLGSTQRAIAQPGRRLVYFVRDDGVGFDPHYAHKLFRAFQRLHPEEEFPGNGIGLATVQRIIARHGGKVWADGAIEQGATFYFTLS